MYEHGYISEKERDNAKSVKVENILKYDPIQTNGKYASYVDRVTQEVKELGYDPNKTKMTIYTYMDHDMQEYLDDVSSGKNYKLLTGRCRQLLQCLNQKLAVLLV